VAFLLARALAAVKTLPPAPGGERVDLAVTSDEDDPAGLWNKIKASGGAHLDNAVAAAWLATRTRFHAWAAREEAAQAAEQADDLDGALAEAADPATPAARLAELAGSEYPRVRLLVAQHAATPAEARARLKQDRDRVVREAAQAAAP
jgi:hypothetical protein